MLSEDNKLGSRRVAIVIGVVIICVTCLYLFRGNGGSPTLDAPLKVTVAEPGSDQAVTISVGQQLDISLSTLGSAGFSWKDVSNSCTFVSFDSPGSDAATKKDKKHAVMVGSPASSHFVYTGVSPGLCELKLGYSRWWDADYTPVYSTFSVTVKQ